jgi:tellurite resistance-related uncharacterized protein
MNSEKREPNPTRIPKGFVAYKRTDEFTPETVPAALTKDHSTKAGTWGFIHVTAGRVLYRITDERRPSHETILSAQATPGVVEPTMLHHVAPMEGARFFVEFWRSSPNPG